MFELKINDEDSEVGSTFKSVKMIIDNTSNFFNESYLSLSATEFYFKPY